MRTVSNALAHELNIGQAFHGTIGWMMKRQGSATIARACSRHGGGNITVGYAVCSNYLAPRNALTALQARYFAPDALQRSSMVPSSVKKELFVFAICAWRNSTMMMTMKTTEDPSYQQYLHLSRIMLWTHICSPWVITLNHLSQRHNYLDDRTSHSICIQ